MVNDSASDFSFYILDFVNDMETHDTQLANTNWLSDGLDSLVQYQPCKANIMIYIMVTLGLDLAGLFVCVFHWYMNL